MLMESGSNGSVDGSWVSMQSMCTVGRGAGCLSVLTSMNGKGRETNGGRGAAGRVAM